MFDVIAKRNWYFALSLLVTIPGLIFILLTPISGGNAGLRFSIDYTGGTRWEIRFENPSVTPEEVESVLAGVGLEAQVVAVGSEGFLEIKTDPIGLAPPPPSPSPIPTLTPRPSGAASASASASASAPPAGSVSPSVAPSGSPAASPSASGAASISPSPSPSPSPSASPGASASAAPSVSPSASPPPGNTQIPREGRLGEAVEALEADLGPIAEQRSLTTIGPVVSSDLIGQALVLIVVGAAGIMLWITYRFRDVKFGATALVTLLHDVIVVVGIFAILGTFLRVEIDALFVTAMLTVIGFSVHDTIVVFDRIRENRARHAGEPFAEVVNHSILQTFGRSITTSLTIVLTLLALLLFGGSATTYFVLALLLGIISGTYSSVFNAAPLLVVWNEWDARRRGRAPPGSVARRTAG